MQSHTGRSEKGVPHMNTDAILNLLNSGYEDMTVSELIANLAGLPPMMDVYIQIDGDTKHSVLFLNEVKVMEVTDAPSFVVLGASEKPQVREPETLADKMLQQEAIK